MVWKELEYFERNVNKVPKKNLLIFGIEDFADIAYEYFTKDSDYKVVGFTVGREYMKSAQHLNLPIFPFEDLESSQFKHETHMFIAITYKELNAIRNDFSIQAKEKGFKLASYVSSRSFVWDNVKFGEHVFIFEDNTIQPFVQIGSNVVLWSGNHIGHHSKLANNLFISSHVVVSGWVNIGSNGFIGVNSTIANGVEIGDYFWISHGSVISKNVPSNSIIKSNPNLIENLNLESLRRSLERKSLGRKFN